jgi:NADP-dependent 3-hydroxy acid dehydrogenase YdfG
MINDALRVELVGTPLRVTLISPGLVETEFSLVRFKGDAEKAAAPYKGITPLHPEDISDAIVYAASRPEHVQVGDITVWATNQGNCTTIYRGN